MARHHALPSTAMLMAPWAPPHHDGVSGTPCCTEDVPGPAPAAAKTRAITAVRHKKRVCFMARDALLLPPDRPPTSAGSASALRTAPGCARCPAPPARRSPRHPPPAGWKARWKVQYRYGIEPAIPPLCQNLGLRLAERLDRRRRVWPLRTQGEDQDGGAGSAEPERSRQRPCAPQHPEPLRPAA